MLYTPPRREQGFSLVEMMIALVLGLLLVAGVLALFTATIGSNRDLARIHQLEDELHASAELIARDLRRAGGTGKPSPIPNASYAFGLDIPSAYTGEAANSCLTFRYDLDADGVLDTATGDERFGYRLKQGVLQSRGGGLACTTDGSPGWQNVTTPTMVEVTQLSFAVQTAAAGDMDVRKVTLTLVGRLKQDTATTRSITRTVRIRNDVWTP